MALDDLQPRTRRSLLTAGIGALVASAASALGRPAPASAADTDPMLVGLVNSSTDPTYLTGADTKVLEVRSTHSLGTGVVSVGNDIGLIGHSRNSKTGVMGSYGGPTSFPPTAPKTQTGVYGKAGAGTGVWGVTGDGAGVRGEATNGGVGVDATAKYGTALKVTGRAMFSRSGILNVPIRGSSVAKSSIPLTTASMILAVIQTNVPDIHVRAVVPLPGASSFTIYLNKATPIALKVAYFVIS